MSDLDPPLRIISGGQTGVDRAALDLAIKLGIPHGGYCPIGRRAEDGVIPDQYQLIELGHNYTIRTLKNITAANLTLIIAELEHGESLSPGTDLTRKMCEWYGYPFTMVNLRMWKLAARHFRSHIRISSPPFILNVAGPRESVRPGIHDKVVEFLTPLMMELTPPLV